MLGFASDPAEWAVSAGPIDYETALQVMEARVRLIADGTARELIWLLEHPPLYTAGTSTKASDLLEPDRLPVYWTGRGGELTYHGPGQRVAYVMLDLKRRFRGDVRAFVGALEEWIIGALEPFGIKGETMQGHIGVWVWRAGDGAHDAAKIAAIGVRVRRGVSFHGVALNVGANLEPFKGIVPCGIRDLGVTSLADLGITAAMKDVDISLKAAFEQRFGPAEPVADPVATASTRARHTSA
jgi:lipoyl(octanoyl) transferase